MPVGRTLLLLVTTLQVFCNCHSEKRNFFILRWEFIKKYINEKERKHNNDQEKKVNKDLDNAINQAKSLV